MNQYDIQRILQIHPENENERTMSASRMSRGDKTAGTAAKVEDDDMHGASDAMSCEDQMAGGGAQEVVVTRSQVKNFT